jgi:polyisoprenyl-phosphate glycosyltransferase
MSKASLISVIVPVFNETEVVNECHRQLSEVLAKLPFTTWELVFIDDGSSDDSYEKLAVLASRDSHVRVVRLSRNFGHQAAITAGLDESRGDCSVIIDADLQDPPEVIALMVDRWREGYEVVYGVRESRDGEGRFKLATAKWFYRLLNRLTNTNIPPDVGDFRLLDRRAVDTLNSLREHDRYVRGLVSWIGYRQTGVRYSRHARHAGTSKYPLRKMIRFALDGITSFSTMPLRFATWLGYAASTLAFIYLASVFVQKALGHTVQGWATIMVAVLFLGGIQLIGLGIMGEYVGRIFNEVKERPLYIVAESLPAPGDRLSVEEPGVRELTVRPPEVVRTGTSD